MARLINAVILLALASQVSGAMVTQLRGAELAAAQAHADVLARSGRVENYGSTYVINDDFKSSKAFDWTSLWIGVGIGSLVAAAAVGGTCFAMNRPKGEESEADPDAEGKEAGKEPLLETQAEEPDATAEAAAADQKATDYGELLKVLAQKVAQEVGPKLAKGGAVRNVLETRMTNFQDKAKNFLLNEMNCTAGAVMKEMNAQEAMLLLDWNKAVEANFPPLSILIAGVLSPTIINCMAGHHWTQMTTVGLPVFVLCIWAVYTDWTAVCAIPTIFVWLYTQCVLAFLLTVGHGMLLWKIHSGKARLDAKTTEVQESKGSGDGGFDDMRQEFVGNTIVLQEALLVENEIRHSLWNQIVGLSTFIWLMTTFWNLYLIARWTFVPGIIAFHPDAAEVAKDDYCGAWATVLVLRISMLLSVLYFFLNVASILHWICDLLVESEAFSNAVLGFARGIDKKGTGLPVVEMLVKAFLLRGTSDTLIARLAVVQHEKASLEKKKVDLEKQLMTLSSQIEGVGLEEDSLRTKATNEGGDLAAQISKLSDKSLDFDNWKSQGDRAIEEAEARAERVKEATTEALQELWDKIQQATEAIENSETAKLLAEKAHEAEAFAEAKFHEAQDMLNDPEFQRKLQEYAQQGMDQAQAMAAAAKAHAEELAAQAQELMNDPEIRKKLEEYAQQGIDQAQAMAKMAQDPEFQERIKAQIQEGAEQLQAAAGDLAAAAQAQAQELMNDPEIKKKIEEYAKQGIDQAEALAKMAQDPEFQEKIKAQIKEGAEQAQAVAESAAAAAQAQAQALMEDPEIKKKIEEYKQQGIDQAEAMKKMAQDPEFQERIKAVQAAAESTAAAAEAQLKEGAEQASAAAASAKETAKEAVEQGKKAVKKGGKKK